MHDSNIFRWTNPTVPSMALDGNFPRSGAVLPKRDKQRRNAALLRRTFSQVESARSELSKPHRAISPAVDVPADQVKINRKKAANR
jgi:hypothetical protein